VSAFGDRDYPAYRGFDDGGYAAFNGEPVRDFGSLGEPDGEEHVPRHRRGTRVVIAVGIGVVALAVVGAAAFGGTILLSHSSSKPDTSVAGAASSGDPGAGDQNALAGDIATPSTEAATASATPSKGAPTAVPTTKAAQSTPPAKPKTTGPVLSGNAAFEAQVLAIVNTERGKAGCKPLAANSKLQTAARKHSADMAARNYFSHDTPEGVDFATRISNEGYRWSGAAENIAKGQRTPDEVMKAWMNSSGHRANILNCGLKDLGVGLAYQGKSAVWTQDFGSQR